MNEEDGEMKTGTAVLSVMVMLAAPATALSCGAADVSSRLNQATGPYAAWRSLSDLDQTHIKIYTTEGAIVAGKVKSLFSGEDLADGLMNFIGDAAMDKGARKLELLPESDNLPDAYRIFDAWAPMPLRILLTPNLAGG